MIEAAKRAWTQNRIQRSGGQELLKLFDGSSTLLSYPEFRAFILGYLHVAYDSLTEGNKKLLDWNGREIRAVTTAFNLGAKAHTEALRDFKASLSAESFSQFVLVYCLRKSTPVGISIKSFDVLASLGTNPAPLVESPTSKGTNRTTNHAVHIKKKTQDADLNPIEVEAVQIKVFSALRAFMDKNMHTVNSIFHDFDADQSGYLDEKEFIHAMEAIGVPPLSPHETTIFLSSIDENFDGQIEYQELLHTAKKFNRKVAVANQKPASVPVHGKKQPPPKTFSPPSKSPVKKPPRSIVTGAPNKATETTAAEQVIDPKDAELEFLRGQVAQLAKAAQQAVTTPAHVVPMGGQQIYPPSMGQRGMMVTAPPVAVSLPDLRQLPEGEDIDEALLNQFNNMCGELEAQITLKEREIQAAEGDLLRRSIEIKQNEIKEAQDVAARGHTTVSNIGTQQQPQMSQQQSQVVSDKAAPVLAQQVILTMTQI